MDITVQNGRVDIRYDDNEYRLDKNEQLTLDKNNNIIYRGKQKNTDQGKWQLDEDKDPELKKNIDEALEHLARERFNALVMNFARAIIG